MTAAMSNVVTLITLYVWNVLTENNRRVVLQCTVTVQIQCVFKKNAML